MLVICEPSITISGTALSAVVDVLGLEPGWVYPSMIVGLVIAGSSDCRVITWGPEPGMSKSMVLVPPALSAV